MEISKAELLVIKTALRALIETSPQRDAAANRFSEIVQAMTIALRASEAPGQKAEADALESAAMFVFAGAVPTKRQ